VHTPHEWYWYTGTFLDRAEFITSFHARCDTLLVKITTASAAFTFDDIPADDVLNTLSSMPYFSASLLQYRSSLSIPPINAIHITPPENILITLLPERCRSEKTPLRPAGEN
jgi:hypothetical protein